MKRRLWKLPKKFAGKSKSTHDVLNDPKLSAETSFGEKRDHVEDGEAEQDLEQQLQNIRKKLKAESQKTYIKKSLLFEDEDEIKKRKQEEIKKEIESVKKEYHKNKLQKLKEDASQNQQDLHRSETLQEYESGNAKYKDVSNSFPKKGSSREEFTLNLLSKFKQKLQAVKDKEREEQEAVEAANAKANEEINDDPEKEDDSWLTHELHFINDEPVLAKDANTKGDDWFEIYDPRNPLNKRRRGETSST
uniref:Uncharacterized protein n=1 Tax=Photinus pyralis TaxID=7054 RepID=A0A1Y1NBM2_PHOPY